MNTNTGMDRMQDPRSAEKRRRDFGIIARAHERGAAEFVSRLPLERGRRLLDVGCGTGNVSIAAALSGADVTGVDPREPFLSRGRAWAKNEALLVRLKPARPEKLPFSDGNFHAVVNFLGLPWCDEPSTAALEMRRVCRRRGLLAVAAWTPDSPVGEILRLAFRFSGDDCLARALELGRPSALEGLFNDCAPPERVESHDTALFFPLDEREVAACYMEFYPPIRKAVSTLEPEAREALAVELADLLAEAGTTRGDGLALPSTYHEIHFRNP